MKPKLNVVIGTCISPQIVRSLPNIKLKLNVVLGTSISTPNRELFTQYETEVTCFAWHREFAQIMHSLLTMLYHELTYGFLPHTCSTHSFIFSVLGVNHE